MKVCTQCGGHLHRIHRTFTERFSYLAIYECRDCKDISSIPRHYRYHLGQFPRCPRCGTLRIVKLKERDHIDRFETGLLNLLERICRGGLYHCKFCRLQFYDRRKKLAEKPQTPVAEKPESVGPAA
jgi:transcription elongation factor Elf1